MFSTEATFKPSKLGTKETANPPSTVNKQLSHPPNRAVKLPVKFGSAAATTKGKPPLSRADDDDLPPLPSRKHAQPNVIPVVSPSHPVAASTATGNVTVEDADDEDEGK